MNNTFEKWEISKNLPNDLSFWKMEVNNNQLLIFLNNLIDETEVFVIKFEYFASFKVSIDLVLMKTVDEILSFRGFARTKSSNYLNSIVEGSYNVISKNQLEHFVIYNLDNAIEVISDLPGELTSIKL